MKLKRSKAYRKLMNQYQLQFNFREPYQVLLDSAILQDAHRFKIDLVTRLESVLQGKVKPMITQCSIRHLYNAKPKIDAVIDQAKQFERRRCNHHELENPLSDQECLASVVDPKNSLTNKHRYVVASQDQDVRGHMRNIAGVPLVYISKSVMIMEPMASATEDQRNREERSKFRLGLKGQRNPGAVPAAAPKRKRDDEEEQDGEGVQGANAGDGRPQKKKRPRGPKQPNPLSMKKSKKAQQPSEGGTSKPKSSEAKPPRPVEDGATDAAEGDGEASGSRKRKRKHKPKGESGDAAANVDGEATAE